MKSIAKCLIGIIKYRFTGLCGSVDIYESSLLKSGHKQIVTTFERMKKSTQITSLAVALLLGMDVEGTKAVALEQQSMEAQTTENDGEDQDLDDSDDAPPSDAEEVEESEDEEDDDENEDDDEGDDQVDEIEDGEEES